jgi:7-cyano-7-deazaguanine synthase
MSPRAVVLLSGGLDSATVAAEALARGFELTALSFDYGQRHRAELDAARAVAQQLGLADHRVIRLDPTAFAGSALTDPAQAVPVDRAALDDARAIPSTYVPARNAIFLSFALGIAEQLGARDLFVGVNALDYSGYPDCRPEFLLAFEAMANRATKLGVESGGALRLHAPLLALDKAGIVRLGTERGVDFARTVSCYDADRAGRACGRCDACRLRRRGFEEAGVPDPTRYRGSAEPGVPRDVAAPMGRRLDALAELLQVVDRLRAPDGCPWDRAQTPTSMARFLLEEAAEAHDAVRSCETAPACEELGDLLLVVFLICRMEEQAGRFGCEQVARAVAEKLVRRHPHVFGELRVDGADAVLVNWERIKAEERAAKGELRASALDGVPVALPALARAEEIGKKAAKVGFEWPDLAGPVAKIREELDELLEAHAAPQRDAAHVSSEVGDLLFAVVNLARHLRVPPETALRDTIARFERRFRFVEAGLGKPPSEATLDEMEALWQAAKRAERSSGH